jgi:hypothetical protein
MELLQLLAHKQSQLFQDETAFEHKQANRLEYLQMIPVLYTLNRETAMPDVLRDCIHILLINRNHRYASNLPP